MRSDAELGNLAIRFGQYDIISGRPAYQTYNGNPLSATRMLGWRSRMLLRQRLSLVGRARDRKR